MRNLVRALLIWGVAVPLGLVVLVNVIGWMTNVVPSDPASFTWRDVAYVFLLVYVSPIVLLIVLFAAHDWLFPRPAPAATPPRRVRADAGMYGLAALPLGVGAALSNVASAFVESQNFIISLVLAAGILAFLLKPSIYRHQTWKRLIDPWLKLSGVSSVAIGGFGFVGSDEDTQNRLLRIALEKSQLAPDTLLALYIGVVILTGIAALVTYVGQASAPDENSRIPAAWFRPACALVWLSAVGNFTMFFNGALLTFLAHAGRRA
ncbi:MAG: hypothetical protein HY824_14870 [Acidobacteria bacterium]|nr:hypothetical protein [Acidobacteriota bacterium]